MTCSVKHARPTKDHNQYAGFHKFQPLTWTWENIPRAECRKVGWQVDGACYKIV